MFINVSSHDADNSRNSSVRSDNNLVGYPSRTVVHPKLEMTEPGDADEREADLAAHDVMSGKVFRKFSGGGAGGGMAVSSQMESQLNQLQGGGQAMPDGLRGMMERGFDRDFSQVRLHTDGEAAGLSDSIHAKAFTHGNDIYFNQGQYAPETSEGQRLVAHELAHVAQGGGKVGREDIDHRTQPEDSCPKKKYLNKNECGMDEDCKNMNNDYVDAKLALDTIINNMQNAYLRIQTEELYKINKGSIAIQVIGSVLCGIPKVGFLFGTAATIVNGVVESAEAKENLSSKGTIIDEINIYYNNALSKLGKQCNKKDLHEYCLALQDESERHGGDYYYHEMKNKLAMYEKYIPQIGPGFIASYVSGNDIRVELAFINNRYALVRKHEDDSLFSGFTSYSFLGYLPDEPWLINVAKEKNLEENKEESYATNLRFTYCSDSKGIDFTRKLVEYKGDYNSDLCVVEAGSLLSETQAQNLKSYVVIRYSQVPRYKYYVVDGICYAKQRCAGKVIDHYDMVPEKPKIDEFGKFCSENSITPEQKKHMKPVLLHEGLLSEWDALFN